MKKIIKSAGRKKSSESLERRLNEPFEKDEKLMRMAWSMSSYVAMDSCSPIYLVL